MKHEISTPIVYHHSNKKKRGLYERLFAKDAKLDKAITSTIIRSAVPGDGKITTGELVIEIHTITGDTLVLNYAGSYPSLNAKSQGKLRPSWEVVTRTANNPGEYSFGPTGKMLDKARHIILSGLA